MRESLLRDVLEGWSELWRFPEVVGVLVRNTEAGAEDLAQALVGGIASPRTPAAMFYSLVDAGEYRAAGELLDRPGFRSALGEESVVDMRLAIERAKVEARQELDARTAGLRARARVVGGTEDPPDGLEEAVGVCRTRAESLIDHWEREIEAAESESAAQLYAQLREAVVSAPLPSSELEEWRQSIERCIKARRLMTARFLLQGGPQGPTPDEPAAVRRPSDWFWRRSPRQALDWLINARPAPPDFEACRQGQDDEAADALARVLGRIVDRYGDGTEPPFGNVDQVKEFAAALDRFLGLEVDRNREVASKDGGFETRLYALDDPRLPCLALQGASGVRLWLPGSSSASDRPPANAVEEVVLSFGLSSLERSEGNIVFFDTFSLLQLFADRRHRKVNFLRELGAKLSPLVAIPQQSWRIDFGEPSVGDMHSLAAWLLDILNVDVEGSELVDMMVYYSGARPEVLVLLVRALLEASGGRLTAVTPERLLQVWRGQTFRRQAAAILLRPLASDPQLRVILGAALFAGERPGGSFDDGDVSLVLEVSDAEKATQLAQQVLLERLVELGLLARGGETDEFLIPSSGTGHLLFASVPDVGEYISNALLHLE